MEAARLVSEEVMHPDRISHLPDDLLFRILTLVPVRIAKHTRLLSKRWNYVWKMMPTLVYVETYRRDNGVPGFNQFCRKSLPSHEALKTLAILLRHPSDSIDTLFPNIGSRTLLEITIIIESYVDSYSPIRFPNNLNVFKTLLVLKLRGKIVLSFVDSPVCFPSLKTLHLKDVRFERKEYFKRILSACPVLEDLFLVRLCSVSRQDYLFPVSISSPSLQRLSIDTKYGLYRDNDPILEISAPSLKYLKIFDIRACYNLIEAMPKLVEANMSVDLPRHENLFKVISSLERLSIGFHNALVVDLTDGLIFNRLLHLELHINYSFHFNLILRLLRHFPNIQSLKLLGTFFTARRDHQLDGLVTVPKCLSFHLEILQWTDYGGALNEKEAAVYIFKNAHRLKTATFSLSTRGVDDVQIMMKDLRSMPKASASCQLVFE